MSIWTKQPAEKRFIAHFQPNCLTGCWEWMGKKARGYGIFRCQRRSTYKAYRFAYEFAFGVIPLGLSVCHACDNKGCVNPDHLYAATHRKNMKDAWDRGLIQFGERNHNAKLTWETVKLIRESSERVGVLAKRYGVSSATITRAKTNQLWTRK